ncbi:LolA family protein [Propionibacteriaceae bacterium G1746]|uniref:LolA family protein n=1 Tax=Aestuariimicrobium sp. G57 TaxID=3418485 RepID=UPI003C1CB556
MSVLQRHPRLRWLVPLTALALVAGVPAATQRLAQADPGLPPRTAEQLLTDLATAKPRPLSGTVQQDMNLGLPTLPNIGGGSTGDLSPLTLLTGQHTWKLWTNGSDSFRVAKVNGSDEINVIHNPQVTWVWNSQTREAVKTTHTETQKRPSPSTTPTITPDAAAKKVLAAIEPTTAVTTDSATTVAGRDAYQLVLTPKAEGSKVAKVLLAIDAETKLPLRVLVTATGATTPAVNIGYTSITYADPDPANFQFTPPADAKVLTAEQKAAQQKDESGKTPDPNTTPKTQDKPASSKTVGEGWTVVHVTSVPAGTLDTTDPTVAQLLGQFRDVSGAWGKGKLLETALFSVVLTDDGRLAVGPVQPSLLYAALS